jgi:hypothetical protein
MSSSASLAAALRDSSGKPPQHLAEQQIEQSKGHAPIIVAR